jgi:hypothetical protein
MAPLLHGSAAKVRYPEAYASVANVNVLFIGSSLIGSALPAPEPARGMLEDGRSCAILSINGISERDSNMLLADAIGSGVETVFLEINTYAHNHFNPVESTFRQSIEVTMRGIGGRLTFFFRSIFNLSATPYKAIRLGAWDRDGRLDVKKSRPANFHRLVKIQPSRRDELHALLADARDANVEVIFVSQPRPQSAVDMMGTEEFSDLHSHLDDIAASFGLPLWYPPIPWPDDHFIDINAHANVIGRIRFQKELASWYGARQ